MIASKKAKEGETNKWNCGFHKEIKLIEYFLRNESVRKIKRVRKRVRERKRERYKEWESEKDKESQKERENEWERERKKEREKKFKRVFCKIWLEWNCGFQKALK